MGIWSWLFGSSPKAEPAGKFCSRCGFSYRFDPIAKTCAHCKRSGPFIFCQLCGIKLPAASKSSRCTRCQRSSKADLNNQDRGSDMVAKKTFVVRSTTREVEGWSTKLLQFGGKSEDQIAFKSTLKAAVQHYDDLFENECVARHGLIAGSEFKDSDGDAENWLFYNLGEWLIANKHQPSIRFERRTRFPPTFELPEAKYYCKYWTEELDTPFLPAPGFDKRILDFEFEAASPKQIMNSRQVWLLASMSLVKQRAALKFGGRDQPFAMKVTISPSKQCDSTTFKMKDMFDGIIASLHAYKSTQSSRGAAALARTLTADAARVGELLAFEANRILLPCDFLRLNSDGSLKQVCPADHLCFLGELHFEKANATDFVNVSVEIYR